MEIEWKSTRRDPFLFRQIGEWPGVQIHRAKVRPGRMLEHTNPFHEVNVAIVGSLTTHKVSSLGKHVSTKGSAGSLCITPAGQPISAEWDRQLDNMGISIDPRLVERTALENRFSSGFEFIEVYKTEDLLVQQIGLTLLSEAQSDSPAGRLFADSLIQTLTFHLLRNYTTASSGNGFASGGLSGHRLRRVQEFIDSNLEDDLSLAEIAAVADLSQYHFARSFRKATGSTPQQFLMHRRIERAKELLTNDGLPIVEVSLRTGFKNQSHFTTLFRKFTSFTPKAWREFKLA